MTETVRELAARKSVRVFENTPVTEEERTAILQSACEAPTAGNQQMYTIIEIRDEALKKTMADLCDHQPFIASAPLVLVFCADWRKWYDLFALAGAGPRKPEVGDLLLAVSDTCIAAQNAVTAAQSLGIGSCYIGDVMENCEQMRQTLSLPEYVFPCAMLVFGRPTLQQKERPKPPRHAIEDIVCLDRYEVKNKDGLYSMFSVKSAGKPVEEWARAFCARKYDSAFSREMSRSVREYLKDFE